jgi:hypothetical protein
MIARLKLWAAGFGVAIAALAASWFAGRKAAQADAKLEAAEDRLFEALRAKEIENEVEALSPADLQSRSRKWVRQTGK